MAIPESQKVHNDLIDIVIESAQTIEEIEQPDGTTQKQLILNPNIVWWKTGSVNHPTFGRMAFELEEWERLAHRCFNHMTKDRAYVMAKEILEIGKSFRRSIDAKSSESVKDKNNAQQTLIDKINKNKIERVYSMKDQARKSILDGVIGRDKEKDQEND